jgi:hypothetical protein
MNTQEQKIDTETEEERGYPIQLKLLLVVIAGGVLVLIGRFSGII